MLPSTQTGKLQDLANGFDPCLASLPAEMRVSQGLAVCLAGSAGVLLSFSVACKHPQPDVDAEQRAALIDAFGPLRPLEGRLAGVPFAPFHRGGPPPNPQHEEDWKRVAREVEERHSPAALANQALVKLALRNPLEGAIQLLEEAVRMPRAGAKVWSDLAAVQLAQADHDSYRLLAALRAADEAVAREPELPEALFNRATIAQRLSLPSLAKQDWQHYLRLDSSSPWAARSSQAALDQPTVAERWTAERPRFEKAIADGDGKTLAEVVHAFPDRVRAHLEGTVFPAWATAVESGNAHQAAHGAWAARVLAALLREETGDALDVDAASAIDKVPLALALDLARAHRLYAEGIDLYGQDEFDSARSRFASALQGFERARSPFSLWTRLKLAACDYHAEQKDQALAAAADVLPAARSHSYWSLVGSIQWLTGLTALERAHADRAEAPLREAREAFGKTRETALVASMDSLLANRLTYLGQSDEAWRFRIDALTAAARAGDPLPWMTVSAAAARALLKENRTTEALHVQSEVLRLALGTGEAQRKAEARWWLAVILYRRGDEAKARQVLDQAQDDISGVPVQDAGRATQAGISATDGEIRLASDPRRAVSSLDRALDLYRAGDNAYSRTAILLLRARAHRRLGEDLEAAADLEAAVADYETQRGWVRPGPQQVTYFEGALQVFDDLIALELDRLGDPDRAFDYAERAKARALLDSLAARHLAPVQPLATAEIERGLPRGTVLIEYAVLSDRVVVWVRGGARRARDAARSIAWKKADLEAEVALAKSIIASSGDPAADTAAFQRWSGGLFKRLIAPILDQVPADATLVVVPDGPLRDLPFAALRDPRSGRFLVERNPLVVAPSATIFLAPFDHRDDRPRDRWHSLAVGGAEINQRLYPEHGLLPQTEQEAREVEAAHRGLLLVHDAATVANFLAALDRFELIHVASHAGEALNPPRPALLLTPEHGRDSTGALDVDAIAAQRLRRPRLAVLAACSAAGGGGLGLEGGGDLARAFVQAGVPAVVGNLWSLGDEEARVFLQAFYRSFWQGESATSALQSAQLAMIHNPDRRFHRPAAWGGFRLLGTAAGQYLPSRDEKGKDHGQAVRLHGRADGGRIAANGWEGTGPRAVPRH